MPEPIPNSLHLAVLLPGFIWKCRLHHLYYNNDLFYSFAILLPDKCLWRYFLPHTLFILIFHDKRAHECAHSRLASLFCIIDPTYMILVVPSNASDNVYCTVIAQSSVYEAMTIPLTQVELSTNDKIVYLSMWVHWAWYLFVLIDITFRLQEILLVNSCFVAMLCREWQRQNKCW
jgi:hypothetical protein